MIYFPCHVIINHCKLTIREITQYQENLEVGSLNVINRINKSIKPREVQAILPIT